MSSDKIWIEQKNKLATLRKSATIAEMRAQIDAWVDELDQDLTLAQDAQIERISRAIGNISPRRKGEVDDDRYVAFANRSVWVYDPTTSPRAEIIDIRASDPEPLIFDWDICIAPVDERKKRIAEQLTKLKED